MGNFDDGIFRNAGVEGVPDAGFIIQWMVLYASCRVFVVFVLCFLLMSLPLM